MHPRPAVAAGSAGAARAQARDAGARIERVADSVYVIIHDDATDEWPHGNTGVIVTADGVLVVDATYLPSRARADIALIRSVTDQAGALPGLHPLALRSQQRGDRLPGRFPAVTIVSERETRDYITSTAPGGPGCPPRRRRRAGPLAALKQEARLRKDSTGRALPPREAARRQGAGQRQGRARGAGLARVVTPNLVFDDELTLWLAGAGSSSATAGGPTARTTSRSTCRRTRCSSPEISWCSRRCRTSARRGRCRGSRCSGSSRRCRSRPWCRARAGDADGATRGRCAGCSRRPRRAGAAMALQGQTLDQVQDSSQSRRHSPGDAVWTGAGARRGLKTTCGR